ncbi:MAG: flagellar hook-length control protein FliK [Defluviitaleaceae bacterium]|nr:flagellar hook-length control protein FliK [Defluviitaleaceae bacterium]
MMKIDITNAMQLQQSQKANIFTNSENRNFSDELSSREREHNSSERPENERAVNVRRASEEEASNEAPVYEVVINPVYMEPILPPEFDYNTNLAEILANVLEEDYFLIANILIDEELNFEKLIEDPKAVSEFMKAVYKKETAAELLQVEEIGEKLEKLNEALKNSELKNIPTYDGEENIRAFRTEASDLTEVELKTVEAKQDVVSTETETETLEQTSLKQSGIELIEIEKPGSKTVTVEVSQLDIIDQIQTQIKTIVKTNAVTEMTMVLAPEQLGELALKLTTRDGLVSASFIVESEKIKEIIEKNLKELQESLELQGVEISDLEVFVKQENNSQMEAFLRESQKSQTRVSQIIEAVLEDEEALVTKEDLTNSLIDEIA